MSGSAGYSTICDSIPIVNAEQDEGSVSLQSSILSLNDTFETNGSSASSDSKVHSAHYQPLKEVIDGLETNEQMKDPSAHALTSDSSNRAVTLNLLNQPNFTDVVIGFRATLGVLTYGCIKSAAELQRLIHRYGPALFKLLQDITLWVRANRYKTIGILGGTTLFALACATPAILGAIGFSAVGPVAGTIAAGWQASMGSVAAGSLFAFLQSAAMGGAAMGVFAGLGALGGGVAVAAGLASSKEMAGRLVEKTRAFFGRGRRTDGLVHGLVNVDGDSKVSILGPLQNSTFRLSFSLSRPFPAVVNFALAILSSLSCFYATIPEDGRKGRAKPSPFQMWVLRRSMGVVPVNAIVGTLGGATAVATPSAAGQSGTLDIDGLIKKFRVVYRRGGFQRSGSRAQQDR